MVDHFVVEADRKAVGVAVRVPGGFRFFFSDPQFRSLDGKTFRRARTLIRRVTELARRSRRRDDGNAPERLACP